jgi:hypothetical protein
MAAKTESSRRAYRADWAHFESWCQRHGLAALSATPETVALYVTALAISRRPYGAGSRLIRMEEHSDIGLSPVTELIRLAEATICASITPA